MNQNCLIFCNCGAGIISDEKKEQLSEAFRALPADVYELHDLCAFSLNEKETLQEIEQKYKQKYIVACFPRAIENMFQQNGITFSNYEVLNFRIMPPENIIGLLKTKLTFNEKETVYEVKRTSLTVPAWYPIVDKSRCTLCGQCARFCVFGVYTHNKKELTVANPLSCKNNCPACGRTCPASAIIFPRLPETSALSGAEPEDGKQTTAPAQNGNLFVMLNERNTSRRNIFKQGVFQQAEEEKRRALEELKNSKKDKGEDA